MLKGDADGSANTALGAGHASRPSLGPGLVIACDNPRAPLPVVSGGVWCSRGVKRCSRRRRFMTPFWFTYKMNNRDSRELSFSWSENQQLEDA